MSLRDRLTRSKVLTWSVTYLAAAWVASQVLGELGPRWGIGDAVQRAADVVLFVWGVPVTIILAWYHGEKGRQTPTWTEAGALGLVTVFAAVILRSVWSVGVVPAPQPPADRIGVAVLPFEHRSALDSDRWFTEAIQDQLINTLGGVDELLVPSPTAVRPYALDTIPPQEIGRQLGVAYLLEGAVQRGGERVLVSVALVSASSGERVWANDFDRTYAAEDIFDVQREVASRAAEQILGRLAPDQVVRFGGTPTTSTEAMELVLRANLLWDDIANLEEAESLYAEATAIDPEYMEAWAQLARTRAFLLALRRQPEWRDPARAALARAETLDPDASSVLTARGYVAYYLDRDYEAAAASLEQAAALRPNDAQIRVVLAALLERLGRTSDAIRVDEEALTIEPRSEVLLHRLVDGYEESGDRDRSRQYLGRWLTVDPGDLEGRRHEAWYRLRDGDVEGMLRELQSAEITGYEPPLGDLRPLYYAGDYEGEFEFWLGCTICGYEVAGRRRLFSLGQLGALMGRDDLRRVYGDSLRIASESALTELEGLDLGAWRWPTSAPKAYLAVAFALLDRDAEMRATAREALDEFQPADDAADKPRLARRLMYAYAIAEQWDAALDMAEIILHFRGTTPEWLAIDPMLQPIRDLPRFHELFGR